MHSWQSKPVLRQVKTTKYCVPDKFFEDGPQDSSTLWSICEQAFQDCQIDCDPPDASLKSEACVRASALCLPWVVLLALPGEVADGLH